MATFTYGFYNAINGDRAYDAIQMSEIFDGMINDGVYATVGDCFIVKQNIEEDNTVVIGSGRAWFEHTWNKLDVPMIFTGPPPESSTNRIDAIVIEVDMPNRTNAIKWITGTPASNPQKPTIIKGVDGIYQHPLCYITRIPGGKKIEQAKIENAVGSATTPFVTGIIDTIDTANLLLQWQAQWNQWFVNTDNEWIGIKNDYADEWDGIKTDYAEQWSDIKTEYAAQWTGIKDDVATEWTGIKDDTKTEQDRIVEELNVWVENKENEVTNWFENDIVGKLEGDIATALQLQVNEIITNVSKLQMDTIGFENKTTTFPSNGDIIETYEDGRKIVTHTVSDSQMTQTYYDGTTELAVKTILFNSDGSIKESFAVSA